MKLEKILAGRLVWLFVRHGQTYIATGLFCAPCPFAVLGLAEGQKLTLYGVGYKMLDDVVTAHVQVAAGDAASVTFTYKQKPCTVFDDAAIEPLRESLTTANWESAQSKDGGRYALFAEKWLARSDTQKILKCFRVKAEAAKVEMALVDGLMCYRLGGIVVF